MLNKSNKRCLFILAIICILILIPASFAEDGGNSTLSLDNNVDDTIASDGDVIYVSDGENEGEGTQANPYNSISKAVNEYNSTKNSKIFIKNGNYKISDQIELKDDINIVGESKEGTVLDGNFETSIFYVSKSVKITLSNLTFKNANGSAALYCDFIKTLDVDNCIFKDNCNGAFVFKPEFSNNPDITIRNSKFANNYNKDGAAIYSNGGSLNVTDSTFENNTAPTGESDASQGGAIYTGGTTKTVYIDGCEFINNTATRGSAVSHYADGELYIINSIFRKNVAPGNSKYKLNSSVINVKASLKELTLYLNNNIIENNQLNDEIGTDDIVKIVYLDKNVNMTAGNVDKYYGDDFNYIINLLDSNGNSISGKLITATLTNTYDNSVTVISNTTDSSGKVVISLKTQKPGKYNAVAEFKGGNGYDEISIRNSINIRTENEYNLIFSPDEISITEGDSYNVTGLIYDAYMVPSSDLNGDKVKVYWDNLTKGAGNVEANKVEFDIINCHLVTRDDPYIVRFEVLSGEILTSTLVCSGNVTVNLNKKDISNIDKNIQTIYVAKNGNDTTGDATKDNPLATIQTALILNNDLGGGRTIMVDEGVYEISTFTVQGNVTVIGKKSKTVLKQTAGNLGMLEIDNHNTVTLINLTFINGYATPEPESLIHVTDESIVYIRECEFYDNNALEGGAVTLSRHGTAYIDNSYFHDNHANVSEKAVGVGGAIYVHDTSYLYVSNSVFSNNTARDGGAIFLGFGSVASIINSVFEENSAIATTLREGGGGAIFTRSNEVSVENCTFKNNYAELYGGAIYLDYGALDITKSYFENNKVKYGSEAKGTAIESSYTSYSNLTMHYSVLISEEEYDNYLVFIHNYDENNENNTVDLAYNYWKTNARSSSPGSVDKVQIQITPSNEFVYTGDVIEFTVEFINSNTENGTSPLNGSVHDLTLNVIPTIGDVDVSSVVIKNNKATFLYTATAVGEETIYLENIYNLTKYKFDVEDGSDKILVNSTVSVAVNKNSTITVTVDADIKNNITIRVNEDDYQRSVSNGKAELTVETLPGTYDVSVIYPGDDLYKGFINKTSFTVDRYASVLNAENIVGYFNSVFTATLIDDEGNPISGESITVDINGTSYSNVTDSNGVLTINLNLNRVGTYDVVSQFGGNTIYKPSNATSKITVQYINVKLAPEENVVITPLDGSFSVKLTDEDNNPISGINVVVTINLKDYNATTDSNGIATVDLSGNGLNIGEYNLVCKVKESGLYSSAEATSKLTVEKVRAVITAEDIVVFAGSGTFNATLRDTNGVAISDAILVVVLNNQPKEYVTDENGTISVNLSLSAGIYNVTVKLGDNNIYKAADVFSQITAKDNTVNINAPDVTSYFVKPTVEVTLTDVDGNPIANEEVIININGNDYISTTNSLGVAQLSVDLSIGKYTAQIRFEGNEIYRAADATSNITVLSSIVSADMKRGYNSGMDFKATLYDEKGNPLDNKTVEFVVNGKKYTAKTDSNGVVKLNKKLAAGKYAITVINPVTGEKTANYAQIVKRLTGNKAITMYFGAGKYYKVRVWGNNGKVVGKGQVVVMKVNGKTYRVKTDKNGYASLKINLKAKTYTITATYKGYKVSNKIKVKPVLTAKNISKKKAKKIKFSAKLVNTKGKAVKGKKITFKVNGKTYKVKTNKKGVATVSIKNLKAGKKYIIKTTYGKSTIKNTIKVKR